MELDPGFYQECNFFKEYVRPLVDPKKPMLYPGSGQHLAPFIGSGVQEAYYVDPVYSEVPHPKSYITGIRSICERIIRLDQTIQPDLLPDYVTDTATIKFRAFGLDRALHIESRDAIGYVPEEMSQNGCSVYLTAGAYMGEFFKHPLSAEVYVMDHISPRAWGFKDVVLSMADDPNHRYAIARGYSSLGLSSKEESILFVMSDVVGSIKSIAVQIREGLFDLGKLTTHSEDEVVPHVSVEQKVILRLIDKLHLLKQINPVSRSVCLGDMREYIGKIFAEFKDDPKASLVGDKLSKAIDSFTYN